jgi:hypothetical protein
VRGGVGNVKTLETWRLEVCGHADAVVTSACLTCVVERHLGRRATSPVVVNIGWILALQHS